MSHAPELIAYHGDERIKQRMLETLGETSSFSKLTYWQDDDVPGYSAETQCGVPRKLAFVGRLIWDHLSSGDGRLFHLEFLAAIVPGTSLASVHAKFFYWLLTSPESNLATMVGWEDTNAFGKLTSLLSLRGKGNEVVRAEWECVADSVFGRTLTDPDHGHIDLARSAYLAVAESESFLLENAEDILFGYKDAIDSAIFAVESARIMGRQEFASLMRDKLIELILEAPMVKVDAA